MGKVEVSQDTLYQYMLTHGIILSRLAELIGKSPEMVMSCFKHHKDGRGKSRYFSHANIVAINKALPMIADELRARLLTFGSKQTYTNQRGATYDPALVGPIKEIGKYLNITALVKRLLGWSKGKKSAVLVQASGEAYGCVSEADVVAINYELLAVAGVLSSYEVVADGDVLPALHDAIEQPAVEESVPTGTPRPTALQADNGTPVEETEYTLDDLYHAFGEEKKSCAARLRNTLERQGVSTLKEFLLLTPGELLDMEGMGSGTLGLIHKALKKMGVRW